MFEVTNLKNIFIMDEKRNKGNFIKKIIMLLFGLLLITTSCGESKAEKAVSIEVAEKARIAKEIEIQSAVIIVEYNKTIGIFKKEFFEVKSSPMYDFVSAANPNWKQNLWEEVKEKSEINKLVNTFKKDFGEGEFNILSIKIDDNFSSKTLFL